jgi:enoyl-[acyl-carrier protein] reductase II
VLKTVICDLFGIKHPIIQGGMAHLSTAELVSAVSNAGGLGIIGAGHYEPDWVKTDTLNQAVNKPALWRKYPINITLNTSTGRVNYG